MNGANHRAVARALTAVFFVIAGLLHFTNTGFYLRIMPRFLPHPIELVYLSGACEIIGGIGLLIPRVRPFAGYGLILLLIAVFPANVTMLSDSLSEHGFSVASVLLAVRLPIQLAFVLLVSGSPGARSD